MADAVRAAALGNQQQEADRRQQDYQRACDMMQAALRESRRSERIKIDTVDPFHPCPSTQERRSGERLETDLGRFLTAAVQTLRNRNVSDGVRKRSLFHHVRGPAREFLRHFDMESDPPPEGNGPTFESVVTRFWNFFQNRENADQRLDGFLRIVRRPGEDILQYHSYLTRMANAIVDTDHAMEPTLIALIWNKLVKECDEELQADLYKDHSRNDMATALNYIQSWTVRRPASSLHRNQLRREEKEAARKKADREKEKDKSSRQANGNNNNGNGRTAARVHSVRALPPPEGWQEGERTEASSSGTGAAAAVIDCYNCDEPGHMARHCPKGSQTQTVAPSKKPDAARGKDSGKGVAKPKSGARPRKCPVCFKTGHQPNRCFLLKRVLRIYKELKDKIATNFMEVVVSDPFHEEVAPVREAIARELDWEQLDIEEDRIDEVITAALTCQDLYNSEDEEEE